MRHEAIDAWLAWEIPLFLPNLGVMAVRRGMTRDTRRGAAQTTSSMPHAWRRPRWPTCSRPHGRALRPRWHRRSPHRVGAARRSCATTRTTTGVDATKSASGRRSRMPENGKTVTRALGHWRLPPRRVPRATTLFREKWRVYMSQGCRDS